MTDFSYDIVGFDLDGTLLDTSGDIGNALNHSLSLVGRAPVPKGDVRGLIGGGAGILLRKALALTGGIADIDLDWLQGELLAYYLANIADKTVPFPGLLDALDGLDQRGIRYAVVTNKAEKAAVKLLGELDLLDRFVCVLGGDTLGRENAKPSPALIYAMLERSGQTRAAFVGDTTYDTKAARNAGIPSIVCSFGFLDGPAHELGGDAVIDHFDALIPALEKLGGTPKQG